MTTAVRPEQRIKADGRRFAAIFSQTTHSRKLYDEVVVCTDSCVVVPTLGSIVPYWLLVIPRIQATNFAQMRLETGIAPNKVVGEALKSISISSDKCIWFGHGATHQGSAIGCGVDQAHIHVLIDPPFAFDKLVAAAIDKSRLKWRPHSITRAYNSITQSRSYLLAASGGGAIVADDVETVGSQFFRRVVAEIVGQPSVWDYKRYPHFPNVLTTLGVFARSPIRTSL